MPAYLEIAGSERVELKGDRVALGTDGSNEVVVSGRGIGRFHALLEPRRDGWELSDLGAFDGTIVNGERIWSAYRLRDGDVITMGSARLVYRLEGAAAGMTLTGVALAPPSLEDVERRVLVVLCGPILEGDALTEPASLEDIARTLGMTDAAVRARMLALYEKFEIYDEGDRRRRRLAAEAIRRGAVMLGDTV